MAFLANELPLPKGKMFLSKRAPRPRVCSIFFCFLFYIIYEAIKPNEGFLPGRGGGERLAACRPSDHIRTPNFECYLLSCLCVVLDAFRTRSNVHSRWSWYLLQAIIELVICSNIMAVQTRPTGWQHTAPDTTYKNLDWRTAHGLFIPQHG